MDQEVEKYKESNYRNAESVNNIKKLKFEVYNEIFSCIEKIKSKYQNSAKEALISEICEKIVKSDFSSFFAISSEINPKNKGSLFEKEYMKRLKHIKLYHYTSMESLYSITKSNSILLSNIQDMNDFSECKLFFDILIKNLRKKSICSDETINYVTDLFIIKLNDVFTFSFSTEDDDAAQWQRYADNGKGVCLVTRIPNILCWQNLNNIHPNLLYPVEYIDRDEKLENIISYEILDYASYFCSKANLINNPSDFVPNLSLNPMIVDCCKIKELSFRNEKEFRIIVYKDPTQIQTCNYPKRYIFNKSNFIRTKLEFSKVFLPIRDQQENYNHCLFTEVILGPKSKADPKVVQDYLRNERGLDVTVSKSNSALR